MRMGIFDMVDGPGYAAFVRAHSRSLFGTAYLLTGTRDAAEDLVQETFAALYPRWSRIAVMDQPLAYVRRSLTNRFISGTRRRGGGDVALFDLPDMASDLDIAAVVADRGLLWQLMFDLPERQRAALVLRYFHDWPDAEIAD